MARLLSVITQDPRRDGKSRHPSESMRLLLELLEVLIRGLEIPLTGGWVRAPNSDQLISIRIGQRTEQYAVHDREDCRVDANPQRQCHDRNRREAGILAQHPHAKS